MRTPPPLIRLRLPSGRGATEQPNSTSDGEAALNGRFWVAVAITGVATGLLGAGLMVLLFNTEYLAFDYHSGSMEAAVAASSDLRRIVDLLVAGAFGGVAWYTLRRFTHGRSEIDDAVWDGTGDLSWWRSIGTSLISEVVVGMGASIGREAAPKLMGGASGSVLSGWLGLTTPQRRLLVACGAGAGLACVYNVPLGGALFTAEIMCGSIALPTVLPALACAFIATATAWVYLPEHATYLDIPDYHFHLSLLVWALIIGPIVGLVAAGYIRLIGWVSHHKMTGRRAIVAPVVALGILGLIGFRYPQLFGNGKDLAHSAFLGEGGITLLLALFVLKPLVTALCLGSGATGGLLTPTMSTGAVLGGFLGLVWLHVWPGSPVGAFALIGAAAMIGSSMQAPLTALVLIVELTGTGFSIVVPMVAATAIATAVARYVDGYSIYTARLGARPPRPAPPLPS